jgi:arylsulfatase A-like enzyme
VLAEVSEVTQAWSFSGGKHLDWKLVTAGVGGKVCRGWEWRAEPGQPGLDPARIDGVSWSGRIPRSTRARISWRRTGDAEGSWPANCTAETSVVADEQGVLTHNLDLGGHPAWNGGSDPDGQLSKTGDIRAIRFEPDGTLGINTTIETLSFSRRGFWGGFEPLKPDLAVDGGLVVMGRYGRRAWPTDFGTPLYCDVSVPRGGRLLFDVALGEQHRTELERVHLAIDVAPAGTAGADADEWERIWYRTLVPRMAPDETLWTAANVDLLDYEGDDLRVRFRAWSGHGVDSPAVGISSELSEASVFWGTPEIMGTQPEERAPNILLVTLDTTRADVLGDGNPESALAPYLKEMAAKGIRFEQAYSASNATQPSHASILTGTWPMDHGVHDNYAFFGEGNITLAERLRARGYHTIGAVSQQYIGAGSGFGQGFDEFIQAAPTASLDGAATIEGIRSRLLDWEENAPDRPFFLWVHLFDAHTPYAAPSGFQRAHDQRLVEGGGTLPAIQIAPDAPGALPAIDVLPDEMWFLSRTNNLEFAKHLYRSEVSYADSLVENLSRTLSEVDQLGATAFFITADHGESLGENKSYFNHKGLMDGVVHVPLIVQIPGGPEGVVVKELSSSIDLVPTILSYVDRGGFDRASEEGVLRGRDLLAGLVTPSDDSVAGDERVFFEHSGGRQVGYREGDKYFITTLDDGLRFGIEVVKTADGKSELREVPVPMGTNYLFQASEGNVKNYAGSQPEEVARSVEVLRAWLDSARPIASEKRETTAAERDDLSKLGYLSED